MKYFKIVRLLVFCIAVVSIMATSAGIFSKSGPGSYEYESIRGRTVQIYGKGLYQHMSAEVAPQGIAQDYVTLFVGIPFLLISLILAGKGSLKGRFMLAGSLGYFCVTYLFFLVMGMYNYFFLAYAFLLGSTFFALVLTLMSFDIECILSIFQKKASIRLAGGFLLFNTFAIMLLWLNIVVPPLIDGSIYPVAVEHYTTLIVQGLDLGLLLPIGAVASILMLKKNKWGFFIGPVYLIFLSLLMLALTAKIIAMGLSGFNIIPVVFIIPVFCLIAIFLSATLLKSIVVSDT